MYSFFNDFSQKFCTFPKYTFHNVNFFSLTDQRPPESLSNISLKYVICHYLLANTYLWLLMSLFVKCCSRHSWCEKDSCCQREKETSQSPARLHFTGFTSHSWKPAGRRSEQWRRRSEQWRTRQRQWAWWSWAQDRVCTQTQDSERANGWEDGWETCAATLLMNIKGLVHPKMKIM